QGRIELRRMTTTFMHIKISDRLDDAERRSIAAYQRRARELAGTGFVQKHGEVWGHIRYDVTQGLRTFATLPSEDDIISFYVALRPFILNDEPENFNRVINILSRHSASDKVAEHYRTVRKNWLNNMDRKLWEFRVDGEELTFKLLIDLWFHGRRF